MDSPRPVVEVLTREPNRLTLRIGLTQEDLAGRVPEDNQQLDLALAVSGRNIMRHLRVDFGRGSEGWLPYATANGALSLQRRVRGDQGGRGDDGMVLLLEELQPAAGDFLGLHDCFRESGRVDRPAVPDAAGADVAVPGMVEKQFPGYDGNVRPDGQVTAAAWLTSVGELPFPLGFQPFDEGPFEERPQLGADEVTWNRPTPRWLVNSSQAPKTKLNIAWLL